MLLNFIQRHLHLANHTPEGSLALLTLLLCLFGWPARAQAPADTLATDSSYVMPAITVLGARAQGIHAGAAFVERLDRAAIRRSGAQNVGELLSRRTGVFIKEYGSGGLATMSMRGASSSQTLLLIDGFSAADPQTGQVDLSLLPTVLLSSVDVLHGAGAARYGSAAIGGVVQLNTLQPSTTELARVTAGAGAYGERRLGALVTRGGGPLAVLVAGERYRREGDFHYVNEALAGSPGRRRTGAERQTSTLYGSVAYDAGRTRANVTAWYGAARRGLPGAVSHPPSRARQWDRHLYLFARLDNSFDGGSVAASMNAQNTSRRYRDPHAYGATIIDDTARTQSYTARVASELLVDPDALLHAGLEAGIDRSALRGGVLQHRAAAFADANIAYASVNIYPAIRFDSYHLASRTMTAVTPRIGASLRLWSEPSIAVTGRLARVFRMPTFGERYFEPGGNSDLRPEHGWSGELGLSLAAQREGRRASLDATVFTSRLDDGIVWRPSFVSPGLQVWTPSNVARVRTVGGLVAASGFVSLAHALRLEGGLTFTHTSARSYANPVARAFNKQLPYVPRERLKLRIGLKWQGLRLDFYGRAIGRRYITADETQFEPAYQVFDARLSYRSRIGPVALRLSLGIEKGFNERYDIIRFYPMPPRHAEGRLAVETAW